MREFIWMAYMLYVLLIEAPVILTFLGGITGVNRWWESRERITIMQLEIQRNEAISMGIMPEQIELKKEKQLP